MKNILLFLMLLGAGYSQCTPFEVSVYISEKDGWMFPYSTFYWGMSDGLSEIQLFNDECYELLENNNECIMNCIHMEQDDLNNNLGRIGCIYYNCPDGIMLTQDYEEHSERPTHLYGELYCADDTDWDSTSNLCKSNISIEDLNYDGYDDESYEAGAISGDLNLDGIDDVLDVVILVNNILQL